MARLSFHGRRLGVAVCGWLAAALATTACGASADKPAEAPSGDVVDDVNAANLDTTQVDSLKGDTAAPEQTDAIDALTNPDGNGGSDAAANCTASGPNPGGCPCSDTNQCDSGYCLDTPSGQFCAQLCQGNCPSGFKCSTVAGQGNDQINICVPKFGNICNPCATNAACQGPGNGGAHCVDKGDGGAFCGVQCSVDGDCPGGYTCADITDIAGQSAKQCVVKEGGACTCSDAAKKQQLSTVCYVTAGASKCTGKRTCLAAGAPGAPENGGLTSCIAANPEDEICDGKDNDCDGQTDEQTCDDKNPCSDDSCNGATGCKHPNNVLPCDADKNVCTQNDACNNGTCIAGKSVVCDDKNACTSDSCDPVTGCKYSNNDGEPCNFDDTDCTQNDACKAGQCAAGAKKACYSDNPCNVGTCDPVAGKCGYKIKDGKPCNDGDPCTEKEKCVGDSCDGAPTNCDDGSGCTADSCDAAQGGCVHKGVVGACDDKDACTTSDVCKDGVCAGIALDIAKKCDDNNACTEDFCEVNLGCLHKPSSGNACDDGNKCTASDSCFNGNCVAGNNNCGCAVDLDCAPQEDGNACNGTLFCDKANVPFLCKVNPLTIVKCDDSVGGGCAKNACDATTGKCKFTALANGLPCDADNNLCTVNDTCKDGSCNAGKLQVCDDLNACTDDVCDAKVGCKFAPNTAPCDADGNACTDSDACAAGTCTAGKPKVCNDNESCTKDSCDAKTGLCAFAPQVQSCNDNNLCTAGDACGQDPVSNKYTCLAGKASACDDANICTNDTCDPVKGCANIPDLTGKVACYSGDIKTKGKGACKAGVATCAPDGKAGACVGEVLPAVGDVCDGIDNNCDGIVDPGCSPVGFTAHYATAEVGGKGTQYTALAVNGAGPFGGQVVGAKNTVAWGWLYWLKASLGL